MIEKLLTQLPECQAGDQYRFRQRLKSLKTQRADQSRLDKLRKLQQEMKHSQQLCLQRVHAIPDQIDYPPELPFSAKASELVRLVRDNQVLVVAGDTGSGKTTQLPKICLQAGLGRKGLIGHTQPRRLAAASVANRVAEELGAELGKGVGYQVRFTEKASPETYLKIMTDGILLAEIQQDRFLNRYEVLIIDEAHERSLNIDFLLGYLKQLLTRRPELKLIITSATIDVAKFSRHFSNAPIVTVSGRTYPVDVRYAPLADKAEGQFYSDVIIQGIVEAVQEIQRSDRSRGSGSGDILVFLATEREIRETAQALRKAKFAATEILPLYARLRQSEQARIFKPHSGRRIVLSTNVAETSITVPGINYVIDTGFARISRYSLQSKIQRLPIEPVSQASANQRKGRCGRLADGICIRLYAESDFNARPEFTDPEILRTNLASVILRMLHLRIGEVSGFPFIEPPESKAINDGFKLLEELNALDAGRKLTRAGRQMATLPVDPKLGRMLVAANAQACLAEMLIIVSALSIQDPRELGGENRQKAQESQQQFQHADSDFLTLVKLWGDYEKQRQDLTQAQLRKFCKQHHLSFMRMREWREVHRQLLLACQQLKFRLNRESASYEQIHKAIISGALNQVASNYEGKTYQGTRNKKFVLLNSSSLSGKRVRWIVTAGLIETAQTFASMAARVEPEWIEEMALHLVKLECFEPHWSKKRQQVMAYEKVALLGLTVIEKRSVAFKSYDPILARELFIKEALVNDELQLQSKFLSRNREFLADLAKQEEKLRRPDFLVSERDITRFYEQSLPATVASTADLKSWLKKAKPADLSSLEMTEQKLFADKTGQQSEINYPDAAAIKHNQLKIDYKFEPGDSRDGATIDVPLLLLSQLRQVDIDWAVPGILRDKCIALLKSLPKAWRKQLIPVSGFVDEVLPLMSSNDGELLDALCDQIKILKNIAIERREFKEESLPPHLRVKIRVVDDKGSELAFGERLADLQQQLGVENEDSPTGADSGSFNHAIERSGLKDWDFDALPDSLQIGEELVLIRFPALVDNGTSVAINLFAEPGRALLEHQNGLIRLYMLRTPQQKKLIKKQFDEFQRKHVLKYAPGMKDLVEDAVFACYAEAFSVRSSSIRDRDAFARQYDRGRAQLADQANRMQKFLEKILNIRLKVMSSLSALPNEALGYAKADVREQIDHLLEPGFLRNTSWEWLQQYPRYFEGIVRRLDKAPHLGPKDVEATKELQLYWRRYKEKSDLGHTKLASEIDLLRWMIEEYRVSLFAQSLGTNVPVSAKRLDKRFQLLSE